MAQKKNTLVRLLVPLGALAAGLFIAAAVFRNSTPRTPPAAPPTTPAKTPAQAPAPAQGPPVTRAEPVPALPAVTPAPEREGLKAVAVQEAPPPEALGSLEPSTGYRMRVEFSQIGAGVKSIRLAEYRESVRPDAPHVEVQQERTVSRAGGTSVSLVAPLAAIGVRIDGQFVNLTGAGGDLLWAPTGPGSFEAVIADASGARVARVTRRYVLERGTYELVVEQKIENLSAAPFVAQWLQFGPVEFTPDAVAYGGDKRRVRFGYLLEPGADPARQTVLATEFLWGRASGSVIGERDAQSGRLRAEWGLWPNRRSTEQKYELSWVGVTSRYFGVAVHAPILGAAPPYVKTLAVAGTVDRVLMAPEVEDPRSPDSVMALRLTSGAVSAAPGSAADITFGLYAGPLSRPAMLKDDAARDRLGEAGLRGLVVYNFGGMCGWCTFSWLTSLLLWLMHFLHDTVLHDWSLAIVSLVVVVRACLHPVNRWSQIRMQRFGKQMQDLAPKQKKIQEKYGSDRKKVQEETAKLWRESGISPFQMVGCIPPFLQTPVWIALYAMLYFAVELRHQPAFFGVFQALTGGNWLFLADLSEPDGIVAFGRSFHIPLVSSMMGPISSFNILPIILGLVFFIHQRYITPPTTANMTPEQKQQQAIVKWMMVVMFPLMMYAAPSGLALYFIANSTIAIFESRWIRSHINRHDLLNPEKHKPARGGGGFLARMQQLAEERRQTLEGRGPRPGPGPRPPPRKGEEPPPRRFRDRR